MKRQAKRKPRGFTLVEIVVALALLGAAVAVAMHYNQRANDSRLAKDVATAVSSAAGEVRSMYGWAGSYSGLVSMQALHQAGLVSPPLTYDVTSGILLDPWGNRVFVTANPPGAPATFSITIGGSGGGVGQPIPRDVCAEIASALAGSADGVRIGDAAAVGYANGVVSGGSEFKSTATGTMSHAALSTGCSAARPVIGLQYH